MGNNTQPQIVTIDGKEHNLETFTQEQRAMLEHCMDLDRKIGSCKFQLDQLNVGKDAFLQMLTKSLEQTAAAVTDVTPKE